MTRIDSPEVQLLELLRRSDLPTMSDRERVRRNVALQIATGATFATALAAAERGSWFAKIWATSAWFKAATVVASLAAAAGGVTAVWSAEPKRPPPVDATAPAVQVRAIATPELQNPLPKPEPASAPEDEATPTPIRVGSAAAPKASNRATTDSLDAELELVSQAQRALKAGRAQDALRALEEHQRRFPAGSLSFERAGLRPIALCQAGKLDEGRAAARNYLRRLPNSVLSKRIRVACQMTDE
jgi:type IV secretory pathway VirB10-like protein